MPLNQLQKTVLLLGSASLTLRGGEALATSPAAEALPEESPPEADVPQVTKPPAPPPKAAISPETAPRPRPDPQFSPQPVPPAPVSPAPVAEAVSAVAETSSTGPEPVSPTVEPVSPAVETAPSEPEPALPESSTDPTEADPPAVEDQIAPSPAPLPPAVPSTQPTRATIAPELPPGAAPQFSPQLSPQPVPVVDTALPEASLPAVHDPQAAASPATLPRAIPSTQPTRATIAPETGTRGTSLFPLSQLSPEVENPPEVENSPDPETSLPAESEHVETQDLEAPTSPPTAEPGSEDDLFEQIFGRPRPQDQTIPVPFSINDQRRGQAIVAISGGRASRVQGAPVLEQTRDLLQPEIQAQLEASADEAGFLSLELLQQVGLTAIFDQSQLALYLTVPPALRRTNVVDALGVPPEAANALPISKVSGYVNVLGGNDMIWAGRDPTGRQPLRLALDGALNVMGWVLEGKTDVLEAGDPGFQRGDVRLVRDDPANALRYIAGDITVPVSGAFQALVPLGGISVSRNFSLQPYRITRPTGEFSFFLERPSQVEIYINGARVQQLRLDAGPQDIRSLSLATGSNDIQLIITDDLGQVQRLDFRTALAGNLLAPGLQQFSYNLGFPSSTALSQRQYDWSQPQLALAHRWGATRTRTLGGYLQATPSFQMVEADGIWASALGNWGGDVALSHRGEVGLGVAARLQYERPTKAEDVAQRSFRVTAEYRDDRFTTLTSLDPSPDWLQISASYGQRLFDSTSLNLGGSYSFGRTQPNTYSLNLGISQSFSHGLSGNINANYSRTPQNQDEMRVFVGLSWLLLLPERRQSLSFNTRLSNTSRASNQLQWRRSPAQPLMAPGWSLSLNQNGDQYGVLGEMSYTDYRFDLKLNQAWDSSFNAADDTTTTHATRLTFGTALVFADGRFGWSRPITNSFALVVPRDRWRGQRIGVNPSGSGYGAVVNGFGPAVIPDLQPYYVSRLRLEALEAPLGYDLGPSEWVVWPSYRSGTLILAGTDATAFARGVLVDANGDPLGLQGGEVVSLSDATWPTQGFFTNRVGRFALMGLSPGRYEIRLRDRAPLEFEIAPDQSGLVDLNTLVVQPAP